MEITLADGQLTEPKAASSQSTIGPLHRFSDGCAKSQNRAPMQLDLAKRRLI
jgi:hypothetical protein